MPYDTGAMHLLGLHVLDLAVVVFFLGLIITIGVVTSRGIKHQTDFFLGGRSLGLSLIHI